MGCLTLIPEKRSSNIYKCSSTKAAQHPDVRCITLTHPFDIGSTETNLGGWCCYDPFLDMDDQVGLSVPGLPSHCFERYQTQKIGTGINGWHKPYDIMKDTIKGKKLEEVGEVEFTQKRSGWQKERKCMEIKMYERTCLRCLLILFVVPTAYYIDMCNRFTDPYNILEHAAVGDLVLLHQIWLSWCSRVGFWCSAFMDTNSNSISYKWLGNPISKRFPTSTGRCIGK